ncbi:glutaminyl-peptide cyclotransferase [Reichenbachiella carrageenanivorans]|uniref:Glutaminyl-peptide cyclotransferase n=1 Tax=Reichenbachiella carrageenanivorans TaxID=2979869 RepID=A0ABY6CY52_9BACT|nr:glutaminyl-peptide cyclotransferase [Reichenbachiella carrageenanivorans]UXX78851.1 glutaminyl-peptide cyclotransferase [Reichenbachiella carrageenanivorans]
MTVGDTIQFKISSNDPTIQIDSVSISTNGNILTNPLAWNTSNETPGKKNLLVSVFLSNGTEEKKRHSVTLFSDIEPVAYTYRTINTYVHDPDAFTQGLLVDNGQLYESTGEKGHSSVRKVDIMSGKVIQSTELSSQYFGEGIGLVNDNIYMLSWKARTGFIFDKNSLEQTGQFTYATEGWGMTTKDDTLIMSDGSHRLRFMDPVSFTELRQIEVYDQTGPVDFLNELEYINGDLFAIRWQTDLIYIIDPISGKVKGILDLEGIFDFANYGRRNDVLNGIAYDKDLGKYYITGKWWPKLFEIQLIPKNNI